MAKTILKDSVLWRELIAVVGFLVCLALHIISMSTTHWAWEPINGDDYKLYGLWRECKVTRVSHTCTSFTTGDDNVFRDSVLWRELIAVVGFLVCLALHIISMSTTHWAWEPINGDDYKLYGLWRECKVTRVSHTCTSFTTGDDNVFRGNEWKKSAQVLTLVGLVSISTQILLSLSIMLVQKIKNNEKEAFGVLMCLLGAYFTCTLLVLLIFGHEINKIENTQISWSYHTAICIMIINIISCVIGGAPLINRNWTCCGNRSINIINDKCIGDNLPETSKHINSGLPHNKSSAHKPYLDGGYPQHVRKYQDENGACTMVTV